MCLHMYHAVQWNLSTTDALGPGRFLLQYRGFPLSQVKNVLVTLVGTKFLYLLWPKFFLLCPKFGGFVKRGSTVYNLPCANTICQALLLAVFHAWQ